MIKRMLVVLPLLGFFLLVIQFYHGFKLDAANELPSALIGQPFPEFSLPDLQTGQILTRDELLGKVALVNVWATWCPTCRAEHDSLAYIAEHFKIPIYGINYKDNVEQANLWLQRFGNPYEKIIVDATGRLGIELGVYGAPETFVIDAQGIIRHRRVGAVDERVWNKELKPVLGQWLQLDEEEQPW